MYSGTTPLTAEELLILDAACRRRHIDFVPSLASLGHFDKILSRPAFRRLAEAEPTQLRAIGAPCWSDAPWSLCVTDPNAKQLLKDMYDEFLPNFSSTTFNICCDEAYDLAKVRSKNEADRRGGPGQLYVAWINYCDSLAKSHGKSIMLWGDIIRDHPTLLPQLPDDAILLEWGYEADHDFANRYALFAKSGRRFYVAPGTSSWLTLASRTKNAFTNIHAAATAGLQHHALGFLNTDWGDHGHQQFLGVSLLGIAYGAAVSWNAPKAGIDGRGIDVREIGIRGISILPINRGGSQTWDRHPRRSRRGGRRPNQPTSLPHRRLPPHVPATPPAPSPLSPTISASPTNASARSAPTGPSEWFLFREKFDDPTFANRVTPASLNRTEAAVRKLLPKFASATLHHPDAELLRAEFHLTAREILHTIRRARLRQAWFAAEPARRNPGHPAALRKPVPLPRNFHPELRPWPRHQSPPRRFWILWLARNRPSRLADVLAEFDRCAAEYRTYAP